MSLLSRLRARPEDPLVTMLEHIPVPLSQLPFSVINLEHDESVSGLTTKVSRADRELGAVAQYELRFTLTPDGMHALEEDRRPRVIWLTQAVVLLGDADAAAHWFDVKSRGFEAYEGREVDGFLFRKVDFDRLDGIADEAAVAVADTELKGDQFIDTYVYFRRDRFFAGVGGSTYRELQLRSQLIDLARAVVTRIDVVVSN